MTYLTHLGGYFTDLDVSSPEGVETLRRVVKLPSLTYLEVSSDWRHHRSTGWIELERDDEGEYAGYQWVDVRDVEAISWGNIYYGVSLCA